METMLFQVTIGVLIVASLLDIYSTSLGFKSREKISKNRSLLDRIFNYFYREKDLYKFEKNPLGRWFLRKFGVDKGLIIHRIIFLPFVVGLFYGVYRYVENAFIMLFGLSCVYLGVVLKQFFDEKERAEVLEKLEGKVSK
jgi:hypothetical protein